MVVHPARGTAMDIETSQSSTALHPVMRPGAVAQSRQLRENAATHIFQPATLISFSQEGIMQFTAVLTHAEEGGYIALNPETGTTTQGETINEALSNLQEATALYLEEFPLVKADHPWVTTFELPAHA